MKSWGPPSPLPSCKQNKKERERRGGKKEEEEDRKAPLMRKNLAILKGNKGVFGNTQISYRISERKVFREHKEGQSGWSRLFQESQERK